MHPMLLNQVIGNIDLKGDKMLVGTILLVVIGITLVGLVRSTETILDIRQKRRDQGTDSKVYL